MNRQMQRLKRFIAVLLSAGTIYFLLPDVSVYATDTVSDNEINTVNNDTENGIAAVSDSDNEAEEDDIILSAGIYEDADRTLSLLELTSDGAVLDGWEHDTDRYIGITIAGLPMTGSGQYELVIEMAPILYLNQNGDPTLSGTTVAFTQNAPLIVNTDSAYALKPYSLAKLTYLIDGGTNSLTLGLPLRYDNALWNKQGGAELGDGTTPLLRVYLQKHGTDTPVKNCDVKLIQATAGGSIADSPSLYLYPANSGFSTTTMGIDESLRLHISRATNTTYTGGYYYRDMKIEITLPTCTIDGEQYTMEYQDILFSTSGGTSSFTWQEQDGVLTLTADHFFYDSAGILNMWFYAPEAIKSITGSHKFTGKVNVMADGISIISEKSFYMVVDNTQNAILKTVATEGTANVLDIDTVQFLGSLALRNEAAFKNGSGLLKVKLYFDSNDTNAIGVTSVQLMCDRDTKEINISYTLVDKNGNLYQDKDGNTEFDTTVTNKYYNPDSTDTSNKYQLFARSSLPEEQQSYHFKTLSYSIGNLDGATYSYHTGAGKASYSAGTVWGYVLTDTIPETMPQHTMEIYKVSADNKETLQSDLTKNVRVKLDAGISVAYGINSAKVSATNAEAGDPVTISGTVFVTSYPYTSNNCLNDIRLGLVLPAGVTVNKASIIARYGNNGTLAVKEVAYKEIDSGKNFWIVEFEQGQKIGYYNEQLSTIDNGSTLKFSLQLDTDRTMSTQTIVLRQSVFTAGKERVNGAGGSYSDNVWEDTYDLNANGRTDDKIGCYGLEATQSITIQAAPAQLEITDSLRKKDGTTGSSLTMDSFADTIIYDLNVECTQGGSASDFFYFIPIAKTGMECENDFLVKNEVSLQLKEAVTVTTESGTQLKAYYTTQAVNGFSDALALSNSDWFESLPAGKSWEDVTMLKIVAAEDTIENGSVNIISAAFGYSGEDLEYEHYAGMQVGWKSRGYYSYQLGHNSSAGIQSTNGCVVTLTYTPEDPIVLTLTAAKDRKPLGEGTVNLVFFSLPQFILAQEYSIKEIKTTNVTLVGEAYDFSQADSVEANENFRITVKVKDDKTETEPVDIQKDGTIVGSLEANKAPTFTFELYNADALSDIVTERYVELTIIGSNGVIVPVKIIIKREMASADATKPAIVAGKQYTPFDGGTSAIVSQNSAFTAQFVTAGLIPDNYSERTLVFQKAPVSGTTITMIDWTDNTELKYYHYTLDGSMKSVKLTAFSSMGSSEGYEEPIGTEVVTERLLFVIQFPESGETIRENMLTLTRSLKEGAAQEETLAELEFTTVAMRTFSLSADRTAISMGENFTLTYTSFCSVTDSRYTGRNLALVIGAAENSSIAADAKLKVEENVYQLNAQGKFIIPLNTVQAGGGAKTMCYISAAEQSVTLCAELYTAATSAASKPMLGQSVARPVTIALIPVSKPSFKVKSMSKRLLHSDDLADIVTIDYESKNADVITIEIQKKEAAGYVTQSSILEAVNGSTVHSQGIFSVTTKSGALELKLSENTPAGTYRAFFTVTKDNNTIEVPFNYIVAE